MHFNYNVLYLSCRSLRVPKTSNPFLTPSPPLLVDARVKGKGRAISPDQALFDAGFDSITAEEFVGRLQERLSSGGWVSGGLPGAEAVVSSTTVFDCPTARHIAEHVEGALSKTGAGNCVATDGPQTR